MEITEEAIDEWFEELSYEEKREIYDRYKEDDDFLENFEWEDDE